MRDGSKNEVMVGTHIWPGYPTTTRSRCSEFFATMKALEPAYKQDDDVAYTWGTKGRVTKCSIYLESAEAGVKNGTGAIVGCEANGVSNVAATSTADPKHAVSTSLDPKHLADVLELFKSNRSEPRPRCPSSDDGRSAVARRRSGTPGRRPAGVAHPGRKPEDPGEFRYNLAHDS